MDASNEIVATDSTVDINSSESATKYNRYYYRHREEILEKKRQQRLQDPEYQAKLKAKKELKEAKLRQKEALQEEKRKIKEEEKKARSMERAKKRAVALGVLSQTSPGCE